jgi:two-component sensor histidine kinase
MSAAPSIDRTTTILLAILAVCFATMTAALGLTLAAQHGYVAVRAEHELHDQASLVADGIDGVFRTADFVVGSMAEATTSGVRPGSPEFFKSATLLPEAANLLCINAEGRVVAAFRPSESLPARMDGAVLERLAAGVSHDTGVVTFGETPTLAISARIEDGRGAYRGSVVALFDDRFLSSRLLSLLGSDIQSVELSDASGNVSLRQSRFHADVRPESLFSGSAVLHSSPFTVTLSMASSSVFASWRKSLFGIIAITSIVALLLSAVGFSAVRLSRRNRRNRELDEALKQKDTLFREVNHRVKNNLAIVQSLLSLGEQQVRTGSSDALSVFRTSSERISAMSSIHEQLYRRNSTSSVDLESYVQRLSSSLGDEYGATGRIAVGVEVEHGIEMPLETAISCGLILNELIANAFKYAFPEGRTGTLGVTARRLDGGTIEFVVSDDGVGMPEGKENGSSMGLVLVRSLSSQIGAEAEVSSAPGKGVRWTLRVPPRVD